MRYLGYIYRSIHYRLFAFHRASVYILLLLPQFRLRYPSAPQACDTFRRGCCEGFVPCGLNLYGLAFPPFSLPASKCVRSGHDTTLLFYSLRSRWPVFISRSLASRCSQCRQTFV